MSYTTVKIIHADERIEDIAELRNSSGLAAFVWSALCKKYHGDDMAWIMGNGQKVWRLVDDERLNEAERILPASTFDRAIIEHQRFADAAKLFREFSRWHDDSRNANHLPTIARLLEGWKDRSCVGMCFQQTSISEDPWCEWDSERDEPKPYDIATEKNHFSVFAEYSDEALKARA